MTTLHINALLFGVMLTILQGLLGWLWGAYIFERLSGQSNNLEATELILAATLPVFFSPVYALSQVVKRFAGINGDGHKKKAEGVPYD